MSKRGGSGRGSWRRIRAPFGEPAPPEHAASSVVKRHVDQVRGQFEAGAQFWTDVYRDDTLHGRIYAQRRDALLAWIDALCLPPGSRVLEVGSGGGLMAVELGSREFQVTAVDLEPALAKATLEKANSAGLSGRVSVLVADAATLPLPSASFDLVVAVAVIQWLEGPVAVIDELNRVLVPGGYLAATFANRARLHSFFDLRTNPYLAPVRRRVADALERLDIRLQRDESLMRFEGRRSVFRMLDRAGLRIVKDRTVGFGPFTILGAGKHVGGKRLHSRLQRLADRGVPVIRSTGSDLLVLARRR